MPDLKTSELTAILESELISTDRIPLLDADIPLLKTILLSELDLRYFGKRNNLTVTANHTIILANNVIFLKGSVATVDASLPTAIGNKDVMFTIKAIDVTNLCRLLTFGTEKIDDFDNFTFVLKNTSITVMSDNVQWFRID